MMVPFLKLFVVFLSLSCSLAHNWNQIVSKGDTVSLNCSDPQLEPFNDLNGTVEDGNITWLLPGEKQVVNATRNFPPPLFLEENRLILRVENVNQATSGNYHCAISINGTWFYIKRGISIEETPTSLLEEYKPNLIQAGIAAGSYLFVWIFLSLVYTFRYREEKLPEGNYGGHWNRALSMGNEAVTSL